MKKSIEWVINEYETNMFVPEDALPEDLMSDWSDVADKTAQEYASENNLTIVNIGGGITNSEDLGIDVESLDFIAVSDDVMDVYISCYIKSESKTMNVDIVATGREAEGEEVERLESHFELQDMSTTEVTAYANNADTTIKDFFQIESADVIQTELGTYVDVYFTNENGENYEDGLTFRIVDKNGTVYHSRGSSGVECIEEGHYKERCILSKCEIGDNLYIEAFDCWSKEVYGTVELDRE